MIFHNRVVIADSSVYGDTRAPPTAEMYICNLFVAYFLSSPVNANKAIFFKLFFVLGTNTLDCSVHMYGFWLHMRDLQGLPEGLIKQKFKTCF